MAPASAVASSCAVMDEMGARPRAMRSWLITTKSCSGAGRALSAASSTPMAATPSSARALSMALNQSLLLGAMLAAGLPAAGAAPAGTETDSVPAQMRANEAVAPRSARRTRRNAAAWPVRTGRAGAASAGTTVMERPRP